MIVIIRLNSEIASCFSALHHFRMDKLREVRHVLFIFKILIILNFSCSPFVNRVSLLLFFRVWFLQLR